MNKFAKGLIAALVVGSCSLAAHAADTTITLNGRVTAAACTINNSGSYTYTMPDVTAATLNAANSFSSTWKTFDVILSNCPAGTSSVTATFDGTADSNDPNKYANATGASYANNVSVQLQNRSGTPADKGRTSTMTVNVDGARNATFDLQARPYSTPGNATVGDINTVVLMNFTYN
ncbi:type 1 fimbrial protein [Serratia fonticola]|uniref:fimbrial protein n=1 Tax=Serratia fonticola TaxID=47917 RepID=UPI0015756FBA|nr:fimbrial protein [Serratia fonticola]NTY85900.1 type 1 fimbrial protein [Serratia fonticola]NTZ11791.1 type 1 fimbrial protein [Serratia fonticola]CAI2065856.1 putative fimbrial protein SthA [Serratia fonticola]